MEAEVDAYLVKATESLQSAESDFANRRFNSCANRAYYACFQAAVAALIRDGIRPSGRLSHPFVHSQFNGVMIDRRKRYAGSHRDVLADLQELRDKADYTTKPTSSTEARRALDRTRRFVGAIQEGGRR